MRSEMHAGVEAFETVRDEWDALAVERGSPFLTSAWLSPWLRHRGRGEPVTATLRDDGGALRAGAVLCRTRFGLRAAADEHSGDWDAVAAGETVRRRLWDAIATSGPRTIVLSALRTDTPQAAAASERLRAAGYALVRDAVDLRSPYVVLPGSSDELVARLKRHDRSEWRRRRRALERMGRVSFRITTGGPGLERDLDGLLQLERSGWKGRNGTAMLDDPSTEALYRAFAREAAEAGMLRLALLELDGELVAAALGCALGGEGAVLKSAFDERRRAVAPGFLLRIEMLRAAIDEGLRGFDLLGGADPHKVRLADELRPRQRVRAYRLPAARVAERAWEAAPRPALVAARDFVAARPDLRTALVRRRRALARIGRRVSA